MLRRKEGVCGVPVVRKEETTERCVRGGGGGLLVVAVVVAMGREWVGRGGWMAGWGKEGWKGVGGVLVCGV